jgi:hypothetical protein
VLVDGVLLSGTLTALSVLPALSAPVALSDEFAAQFMDISSLLIPHRLNPIIGERMANAMVRLNPALPQQVAALLEIAKGKNAKIVEDFFPDVPVGALKDAALSIIASWYMGVAADVPGAEVIAFEFALMFQPTRDVMTISSYAKSGPNGWNANAPALSDMPTF